MTVTKKRPLRRARKPSKTDQLAKELAAVKADVAILEDRCRRMNRTLLYMICPKEWFTEEVDDDELWAKAVPMGSFDEWIAKLSK